MTFTNTHPAGYLEWANVMVYIPHKNVSKVEEGMGSHCFIGMGFPSE